MNQRIGGLVHLPGRSPVYLDTSSASFFREPAEQVAEASVKQRTEISLLRAMGVELQKDIFANGRGQIKPLAYARGRWQIVTGKFARFQARQKSSAESQSERSGNHQQVALPAAANPGFGSAIKGFWKIARVVCTPINLVYYAPLGRRGSRGHGEIGVAAKIAQQSNLAIQATTLAIRTRVVERPVAMDEAEDSAAFLLPKQTVVARQAPAVFRDFPDEGIALLIVVMQMHFHIAYPEADHFRYAVE
jgi:hypothetical protein